MEFTEKQLMEIIAAANEVITALADENENFSKADTEKVIRAYDYLTDDAAPPEVVKRLAEIALAAKQQEPVAYIFKHPAGKLFWALTDESNKGQSDVMPVYAAPSAPVVPEDIPDNVYEILVEGCGDRACLYFEELWNACRAAMLNGG